MTIHNATDLFKSNKKSQLDKTVTGLMFLAYTHKIDDVTMLTILVS